MGSDHFLHELKDFDDLIQVVSGEHGIVPQLIEKDYWIMHCLFGLTFQGFSFQLKGGTSLSKGYGITDRFSEDIDIQIDPPAGMDVKYGKNHTKKSHIESRRKYFERGKQEFSCMRNGVLDTAISAVLYGNKQLARNNPSIMTTTFPQS